MGVQEHPQRADPRPSLAGQERDGKVGWLGTRFTNDGWHYASFKLDPSFPQAAVAFARVKVGCPVPMGHCDTFGDQWAEDANAGVSRTTHAYLTGLSILDPTHERAGSRAPEIVRILEPAKPVQLDDLNAKLRRLGFEELKPLSRTPARTSSPTSTLPSDSRRVGENLSGDDDLNEPGISLDELARRWRKRHPQRRGEPGGTVIRRNCGTVLAVR